ncbi:hypothetical protein RSK20926_02212 [Roseobacter sp. SK209-2-6]|uniref:hypothetical protein n=1 Tax=Roseobacter sp. SK209-2-6 TaxID=388739 RepID=UPI0000F3E42E|nr:hypothetical protein [Roseobacter sp. SK209-2-6]EBA14445.1 hypothetical protein RSK20926_02212 [Roseobacter sp. SK209-2-6]
MKKLTLALAAVAGFSSSAYAEGDKRCDGLSGWYGASGIVVGEDGKTVNVFNTDHPNAYGTCEGTSLKVNFPWDRVISATFNGSEIKWDNGTTWVKQQ